VGARFFLRHNSSSELRAEFGKSFLSGEPFLLDLSVEVSDDLVGASQPFFTDGDACFPFVQVLIAACQPFLNLRALPTQPRLLFGQPSRDFVDFLALLSQSLSRQAIFIRQSGSSSGNGAAQFRGSEAIAELSPELFEHQPYIQRSLVDAHQIGSNLFHGGRAFGERLLLGPRTKICLLLGVFELASFQVQQPPEFLELLLVLSLFRLQFPPLSFARFPTFLQQCLAAVKAFDPGAELVLFGAQRFPPRGQLGMNARCGGFGLFPAARIKLSAVVFQIRHQFGKLTVLALSSCLQFPLLLVPMRFGSVDQLRERLSLGGEFRFTLGQLTHALFDRALLFGQLVPPRQHVRLDRRLIMGNRHFGGVQVGDAGVEFLAARVECGGALAEFLFAFAQLQSLRTALFVQLGKGGVQRRFPLVEIALLRLQDLGELTGLQPNLRIDGGTAVGKPGCPVVQACPQVVVGVVPNRSVFWRGGSGDRRRNERFCDKLRLRPG